MKQLYLECGKIINTHGFRGEVKLESWCDTPDILADLPALYFRVGEDFQKRKILHASVFKQFVIAALEGVADEDAANRLRNRVVYAAREDLPCPEGGNFIADLIGLDVKDAETGRILGKVLDVDVRGAQDLYVVRTPKGEALIPAVSAFVVRVDTEDGIYIRTIPGLIDGGSETE